MTIVRVISGAYELTVGTATLGAAGKGRFLQAVRYKLRSED